MRIAVISHNYNAENLQLQPWRYLHEIIKGLKTFNCEVIIVTDGYPHLPKEDFMENVPIARLRHVKHFPPSNFDDIIKTVSSINPDVTLWLMGLTSFFQRSVYERLRCNVVALVSSPVYSVQELFMNLRITDVCKNAKQLMTSFAETLTPKSFIRKTFNLDSIKAVVTMSETNNAKLRKIGVRFNKLITIPVGVDPFFLQIPSFENVSKARNRACGSENNCFLITFFGPLLTIRGIDTLLLALKLAIKDLSTSKIRLLILSREQRKEQKARSRFLEQAVSKLGLSRITTFEHGFLTRDAVKVYLAASDLLVLPFKHVVSDVPVSIMEGMCLGKPVLSTNLDGIPELLSDGRGLVIEPGNVKSLAHHIAYYCRNVKELEIYGKQSREYMLSFPRWEDSAFKMFKLLRRFSK